MLEMIVLGFLIPWITAIYIYRCAPKIFFTIAPIAALIALTINQLGIHAGVWIIHTKTEVYLLHSLFVDLGIITVAAVWFSYLMIYQKRNAALLYLCFPAGMTGVEYVTTLMKLLEYGDQWNFFYTLLLYLWGFITIDWISRKLVKLGIFP